MRELAVAVAERNTVQRKGCRIGHARVGQNRREVRSRNSQHALQSGSMRAKRTLRRRKVTRGSGESAPGIVESKIIV